MHIDVGFQPNRSNLQSPLLWHSGRTTRKLCWLDCPRIHPHLRNRVKVLSWSCDRSVSNTASHRIYSHLRRCWCTRLLRCSQLEGYFHLGIQLSWVPQWVDVDLWNSKRSLFMTDYPVATVIAGQSSWNQCAVILVTRASDPMAAHDPRLWETLQEFSQNLAIWTSRRMLLEQTGN